MCTLCMICPINLGEIFPGYYLGRARINFLDVKSKDWYIVRQNDPDIIWQETPRFVYNEDDEECAENDEYMDSAGRFVEQIMANSGLGMKLVHDLVSKGMAAGYIPEEHGLFEYWLYDYLVKFIKNCTPTFDEPVFDNQKPDTSITIHTI